MSWSTNFRLGTLAKMGFIRCLVRGETRAPLSRCSITGYGSSDAAPSRSSRHADGTRLRMIIAAGGGSGSNIAGDRAADEARRVRLEPGSVIAPFGERPEAEIVDQDIGLFTRSASIACPGADAI